MDRGDGHMMHMATSSPDCKANDDAFLTSVAWCMSNKCADEKVSKIEAFWEIWLTGDRHVPAKWSYSEALAEVDPKPPRYQLNASDMYLNETSVVEPVTYLKQWNVLGAVFHEIVVESTTSIAIVIIAIGIPVLMTIISYLPWTLSIYGRLKPYLLWPSTIGSYSVRPLPWLLGNAPTIGQALYIAIVTALTVVFCAIDYSIRQPSGWFASGWRELIAYLLYRTGALAFALLPVVFLFASRNNLLLWFSNWSHSTFMLLHRWVARLFAILAILHSIFGLLAYKNYENTIWWKWGAAATVLSVVLWLGGGLYVRRANYELFLLVHIVLSVAIVVGCWYHLVLWYESMGMHVPDYTSGYEVWLYIALAVWAFDRVARVARVVKGGFLRSRVKDLGAGYVRVDIPGVRWGLDAGKHAYAYFPTLSLLRPWENHPFSIIPTAILQGGRQSLASGSTTSPRVSAGAGSGDDDVEKTMGASTKAVQIAGAGLHPESSVGGSIAGVTLFIKKSTGITKHLGSHGGLLTLLEGPYSSSDTQNILRCDRILLIAGGIGITGVLPYVHNHLNTKLAWSVKQTAQCLVDELAPAIPDAAQTDIRIGRRLDLGALIEEEASGGWQQVGVVVSGPGPLCDEVRALVAATARRSPRTLFELEVDAYSW